jgi:hypothetical protein
MNARLEHIIENLSEDEMKELLTKCIGLMPFIDFIDVVKECFDSDDKAEIAAQMED